MRPRGLADWRPQAKSRVLIEQVRGVIEAANVRDNRGDWSGGTVQAEALSPADLAHEVRTAIEARVDRHVYDMLVEREGQEREELVALVHRQEAP